MKSRHIFLIFLLSTFIFSSSNIFAQKKEIVESIRIHSEETFKNVSKDTISNCQRMYDSLRIFYRADIPFQKMPSIIGGYDSLLLGVKYPKEAFKNKIEGKVSVLIIVDTTGMPMCPKILGKKLGYGCDEEAIRLVMNARFTPAISRHKKKIVEVVVPISFELKKKTE